METVVGKVLGDLAHLVQEKWYSGMGLIGLVIVMWTALIGTPHDDILIGSFGAIMMLLGFGEAETRKTREGYGSVMGAPVKTSREVRVFTWSGIALLGAGGIAVIVFLSRGAWLILAG